MVSIFERKTRLNGLPPNMKVTISIILNQEVSVIYRQCAVFFILILHCCTLLQLYNGNNRTHLLFIQKQAQFKQMNTVFWLSF